MLECFYNWTGLCPKSKYSRAWNSLFFTMSWTIWEAQDKKVFNDIQPSVSQAVDSVKFHVVWWFKHIGRGSKSPVSSMLLNLKDSCISTKSGNHQKISTWNPPSINALKFNMDGSMRGNPGNVGFGGVLRNNLGIILGLFLFYVRIGDSRLAEILAIHKVATLCSQSVMLRDKEMDIVSDSSKIVTWVNSEGPNNLEFVDIIYETRHALSLLGNTRVIYNPRSSNALANSLAKNGSAFFLLLLFVLLFVLFPFLMGVPCSVRLVLIKAVLSILPTYYLSMFKIPVGVAQKFEKFQRSFLWGDSAAKRKLHVLDWVLMCRRKQNEGLGIGRVLDNNKALLAKWVWRFGREGVHNEGLTWDWQGEFSVSSFHKGLEDVFDANVSNFSIIWQGIYPSKIEFFPWQLYRGRVLVKEVLCLFSSFVGIQDSNTAELMAIRRAVNIVDSKPSTHGPRISILLRHDGNGAIPLRPFTVEDDEEVLHDGRWESG
ncbi:hypothetical protein Ddye_014629 [Dipteronia dyeriana]|uniref:RNase H type-1 domain-containing protein n=1 Tax=Dipteronia dyeriana TaxID=168575 RepID=A0AAD9X965_9ROSI|nr:hypothetical protein Ddye_014629 [Dipteronia dyeriana]